MENLHNVNAHLQELDARHHLHPFTDSIALEKRGARVITKADGVYLWDAEGNKFLDGMAGLWCVNVGYGRKEILDAVAAQMQQLPYYNTFFQTTHPPVVELSAKVAELTPEGLNRVFFCSSGSEANDTVLRMVRHYWASVGMPSKHIVISRENAYHGSTMAGASLGGMKPMHRQGGLPIAGIEHIMQPHWFLHNDELSEAEVGVKAAEALEEKILAVGADNVAAFIAEPVQGAGGVIVPPDNYWPLVQDICTKHNILLVADEVICGFGRTGNWFGCNTFNIKPDLMAIAKGLSSGYLPIGGVVVSDKVGEGLDAGGDFNHGYTYSGHPACAAAALANIEILQKEKIIESVAATTAPYLQKRLAEFASHPNVGQVRGVGMLGAIQLVPGSGKSASAGQVEGQGNFFKKADVTGIRCREHCISNGLVMRAVDDAMILSPPLIITETQIDELCDKALKSIEQTFS